MLRSMYKNVNTYLYTEVCAAMLCMLKDVHKKSIKRYVVLHPA
jgi:hypothetical protein